MRHIHLTDITESFVVGTRTHGFPGAICISHKMYKSYWGNRLDVVAHLIGNISCSSILFLMSHAVVRSNVFFFIVFFLLSFGISLFFSLPSFMHTVASVHHDASPCKRVFNHIGLFSFHSTNNKMRLIALKATKCVNNLTANVTSDLRTIIEAI